MKQIYSILISLISIILLLTSIYFPAIVVDEATKQEAFANKSTETITDKFFLQYKETRIYPWEQNGIVYFFLPSSFHWEDTTLETKAGQLQIDGKIVNSSETSIFYELEKEYDYCFTWKSKQTKGKLQFLQSANIGTVFIETSSGSMERIDQDKEYRESGVILITDAEGIPLYNGFLNQVKSRGNATWNSKKKSYSIKLSDSADLFAMGESKNWILLSNVFDGNKLQNKICLEMATAFGLKYAPECTWIDLYLNGDYWGNYLLCEKIEVGENRVAIEDLEKETELLNGDLKRFQVFNTGRQRGILAAQNPEDISGGYIIEGDHHVDSISGFVTDGGNLFSLQAPQYATLEQVTYISNYMQQIEDMIYSGNNEMYDYIDLNSFVSRYLLEEIIWNFDFGMNSMYFYKYQDDQHLYSGPAWDYDCSLGRYTFMDYDTLLVFNLPNFKNAGTVIWYPSLYENEIFYQSMVKAYKEMARPYIQTLFMPGGTIDLYAQTIQKSIAMDMLRWNYVETWTGHYEKFENNVRYLKYFLAKRLRFFDQEWLAEDNHYEPEKGNGEWHTVTFTSEKGTKSFQILDGDTVAKPPDHLLKEGEIWHNYWNWEDFSSKLPIYENFTFYSAE